MPSASGVTAAGCPILVNRTLFVVVPDQRGSSDPLDGYPVAAFVRPSCGRFVVQYFGRGERFPVKEIDSPRVLVDPLTGEAGSDTLRRSSSRRRSAISDYCAHNGLGYLLTLTFRSEPFSVDGVWSELAHFVRRLRVSLGDGVPYVAVIERGGLGRLHVHMCVGRWYVDRVVAVRCLRCVTSEWEWRSEPPADGVLCLGCVWGLGFVHGPSERVEGEVRANGDARRAAMYVSKYVSKDLLQELGVGRQLYRVAHNFQPLVLRVPALDVESACRFAAASIARAAGAELENVVQVALHETVSDWPGRPTWVGSVPLPMLPEAG